MLRGHCIEIETNESTKGAVKGPSACCTVQSMREAGALSRTKLAIDQGPRLGDGPQGPGQTRVRLTEMPHLPPCIWTTGRQRARGCSAGVRWR
ncbi:hypothetical protein HDV63DRAFT_347571 [Trichoderma sp. SZMC 28014]